MKSGKKNILSIMAINGIHYDVAVKVTDQILNQLTLGEEEIVEILANAYAESNFCIPCRGLFALQASALSHKIPKKEENDLENKLCAILRAYVGETGKSEGAVDVLLRLEDELLKYRRGKGKIPKNEWKEEVPICSICGGKQSYTRGRYPGEDNRLVCPTCCIERLEQIRDIADKDYGKAYIAEQALLSGKKGEGK